MSSLTATPQGLEVRADETDDLEYLESLPEMTALGWLLEDFIENGWTLCEADEIGALSNAPVLSRDMATNDRGDYEVYGPLYYFEPYQVVGVIETIKRHGVAVFTKASAA